MKKDDVFYGLEHWEKLESDLETVTERVLENACYKVGEGFDAMADRVTWPIRIFVFKRKAVGGEKCAAAIAYKAIEQAFENLDDDYSDPDGCASKPSEAIKEAALAFGRAVVAEYIPWICEPTGEVIEYTREQIKLQQ